MSNAEFNTKFLEWVTLETQNAILKNIAEHYGRTTQEIFEELTDAEAEHILEYVTTKIRDGVSVLCQKFALLQFNDK